MNGPQWPEWDRPRALKLCRNGRNLWGKSGEQRENEWAKYRPQHRNIGKQEVMSYVYWSFCYVEPTAAFLKWQWEYNQVVLVRATRPRPSWPLWKKCSCLFSKVQRQGTKRIGLQTNIAVLKLNKPWAQGISGPRSESTGDEYTQNRPSFQRGNVLSINIWSLLIERICTAAIPRGLFKHCSHMGPLCLSPLFISIKWNELGPW